MEAFSAILFVGLLILVPILLREKASKNTQTTHDFTRGRLEAMKIRLESMRIANKKQQKLNTQAAPDYMGERLEAMRIADENKRKLFMLSCMLNKLLSQKEVKYLYKQHIDGSSTVTPTQQVVQIVSDLNNGVISFTGDYCSLLNVNSTDYDNGNVILYCKNRKGDKVIVIRNEKLDELLLICPNESIRFCNTPIAR